MTTSRPSLPEYAHPPLVAATLGVYYNDETLHLTSSALPEFQRQLGPEWIGNWQDVREQSAPDEMDFGIDQYGDQLTNVLGDRVIRVTNSLISFTWLGTADARYPRYENLRDGFVAAWDVWSSQLTHHGESVYRWAAAYLNRIPQGTVWQTPADWKFFQLHPQSTSMSVRVERAQWVLRTPELDDGLSVSWMIDAPHSDAELPAIWLKLLATGDVDREESSILDGMDAGRAAIVKTFSDLMSPAANAYWGLRRRES